MMENQTIIMIISGVCGLILHATIFGVIAGRVFSRLEQHAGGIRRLSKEMSERYVTKESCDGVNKTWRTFVDGVLEQRDLREAQHKTDYERLLVILTETQSDISEIKKCLTSLQNNKEC